MRSRRGPFASVTFSVVVVLAIGAVAWGLTHNKSAGQGIGNAKEQAAAHATLVTGLKLPAGIVRDPTFTACGNVADACFAGNANAAQTLIAFVGVVHAAGGKLPSVCSTTVTPTGPDLPRYTCVVQGELKGAEVLFGFGDGWLLPALPGQPAPRTAVLATVVTDDPHHAHTASAGTPAEVAALLPATWANAPQLCAGGSTPPAASSAASAAAPAPLVTTQPLPSCAATAITVNVSVQLALTTAAAQLAAQAHAKGFRLDGNPCIAGSTATSCGVWGERITSGVEQLFVATLTDDGRGDTIGSLSVTQDS